MDYTKIYRNDIAALLAPGDQVLAVVPYQLAPGAERLGGPPEELERRIHPLSRRLKRRMRDRETGAGRSRGSSMLLSILFLDFNWPWNRVDVDEKLAGIAVLGSVGSHAVRIADAAKRGDGDFLVVTGQRLIVVRQVNTDTFESVFDVPRADVVFARRARRPPYLGRVVIGFADGSRLAVVSGVVFTWHAKRLVAALSP